MNTSQVENFDESMQVKTSSDKKTEESYVSFTKEEWEYFFKELKLRPLTEENLQKAINNARYLAMLDRGFKEMEEGKGTVMTFEELEKLIYG
ncbi:MAG: hypothetical protein IJ728_07235 [Selenomonadaceae bacterium]|nr:hypothetical protein [Selenomonadaceae bacterium]